MTRLVGLSGSLLVSRAGGLFGDGRLRDDKLREKLREFVGGFLEFAAGHAMTEAD